MFQIIVHLVTIIACYFKINGEVFRNDDFTEFSAIFTTQESSRYFAEGTLIEKDISSFQECLYFCMLYLKCGFINYHKDQKVCELLANVTTIEKEIGWLSSRATDDGVSTTVVPT